MEGREKGHAHSLPGPQFDLSTPSGSRTCGPGDGTTHSGLGLSISKNLARTSPSTLDMPTGQPSIDSPSLRLYSQVTKLSSGKSSEASRFRNGPSFLQKSSQESSLAALHTAVSLPPLLSEAWDVAGCFQGSALQPLRAWSTSVLTSVKTRHSPDTASHLHFPGTLFRLLFSSLVAEGDAFLLSPLLCCVFT